MATPDSYFMWMIDRVFGRCAKARLKTHSKLLLYLYETPYVYRLDMDENRFKDGISLRWIFFKNTGLPDPIDDDEWCSMLEMMVALANRCETDIMANEEYGDRTREWFWDMIRSLGLDGQTNDVFDETACAEIIDRFLNGAYDFDGSGGLFSYRHPHYDIHDTEIWRQLQWYLKEEKGG